MTSTDAARTAAALPAVSSFIRVNGRAPAGPLFAGSYLAVWTLAGLAVYALYEPHGSFAAGALTIAAGIYELTPFKRDCHRRCRTSVRAGGRRLWTRANDDVATRRRKHHDGALDGNA